MLIGVTLPGIRSGLCVPWMTKLTYAILCLRPHAGKLVVW